MITPIEIRTKQYLNVKKSPLYAYINIIIRGAEGKWVAKNGILYKVILQSARLILNYVEKPFILW